MDARPIDPRDTEWELSSPVYRVSFFAQDERGGWSSDAFELDGAGDVAEALSWAERESAGRVFVLYALVEAAGEGGLVRLAGTDPLDQPHAASPARE
ncbi:MAG TPA: hypothetical protein VFW80_09880 [Gaiellaceae bacterium]|nr:hypothetical protein [Gaiellaceae bacterium]